MMIRSRDSAHRLDAFLFTETRPGAILGDIFRRLKTRYADEGLAGEWMKHHQGGLTGYDSRELKVNEATSIKVAEGQAYAWNPSITGFKAEDTFIVGEDGNHVVTATPNMPTRKFEYRGSEFVRPDILERS